MMHSYVVCWWPWAVALADMYYGRTGLGSPARPGSSGSRAWVTFVALNSTVRLRAQVSKREPPALRALALPHSIFDLASKDGNISMRMTQMSGIFLIGLAHKWERTDAALASLYLYPIRFRFSLFRVYNLVLNILGFFSHLHFVQLFNAEATMFSKKN